MAVGEDFQETIHFARNIFFIDNLVKTLKYCSMELSILRDSFWWTWVVPKKDNTELIKHLRDMNFGVTVVDAEGAMGTKVKIVFTIAKRKDLFKVISAIDQFNPHAFYTIEEIKTVKDGYFGIPIQPKGIGIRERLFKRK